MSWFSHLSRTWQTLIVLAACVGVGIPIGGAMQKGFDVIESISDNQAMMVSQQLEIDLLTNRVTTIEQTVHGLRSDIRQIRLDITESLCLERAQIDPKKDWRDCIVILD